MTPEFKQFVAATFDIHDPLSKSGCFTSPVVQAYWLVWQAAQESAVMEVAGQEERQFVANRNRACLSGASLLRREEIEALLN